MATQFKKTGLAVAIGAAALGLSAAANAVVVVGGDNGWEVSFDGNINAFYVNSSNDQGWDALGLNAPASPDGGEGRTPGTFGTGNGTNISRVESGFLPAFFSFNVKSPTVNGMTGSARFSFAPTINNSATKNQVYASNVLNPGNGNNGIQGASIDTREVLVNLDGSFGTVSYGRTLSIFGRQAILHDMTLFGVGLANQSGSGVTNGRIGRGYTYPNFNARFSYKTPVFSGFQAEIGLYDPSVEQLNSGSGSGLLDKVDVPRFEGELNYNTAFTGGGVQFWFDGLWQDIASTRANVAQGASTNRGGETTVRAWGMGAEAKYMGFAMTGYYYDGQGLGRSLQFLGGTQCNTFATTVGAQTVGAGSHCEAADDSGYYLQGTYTFLGKTKVGLSYGESREDAFADPFVRQAGASNLGLRDARLSMWTVGVYHDVNSWLKLIAEYSNAKNNYSENVLTHSAGASTQSDTFSIGSFFFW